MGPARVRVINVDFDYGDQRRPIFQKFNLTLEPGERVAIIGPNGAGKSTLLDLLLGLRDPVKGVIEIDDIDLRDWSLPALRCQMAIVKGIEIFEGTLIDNVRMGRGLVGIAEVRQALDDVGLLEDVLDLPDGLQTILRTGGSPLSLGQAQRLMVARAILSRPRLLVLDEVLDDMDHELQNSVLPTLMHPQAPWTLLVITHSKEVADFCDRTVRLDRIARLENASSKLPDAVGS